MSVLSGPEDGVTSVCFSPDGRSVAAGSLDKITRVWDVETGYCYYYYYYYHHHYYPF